MTQTDDATAIHIVKTIAQARLQSIDAKQAGSELSNPGLRVAIAAVFGNLGSTQVSEGDVARSAIDLLAQDPAFVEPIRIMVNQSLSGSAQRYLDPAGIALTTAALLVLQTRVKFKRDHTGQWSLDVEKKSISDSVLKLFVQRLLAFLESAKGR